MGLFAVGTVVSLPFPFSDLSSSKVRPARGEVIQRDDQGRELQVLFRGDWMLTAWNDQATKEIRVMELVYV